MMKLRWLDWSLYAEEKKRITKFACESFFGSDTIIVIEKHAQMSFIMMK
jgi:hypothetical protein